MQAQPHRKQGRCIEPTMSELDGLRALDMQAITRVHDRYYPEVFRFARYRLDDEVAAQDIAGEVFVRLLEAVHAGRGPQTNLRGWLFSTTHNMINDHYRRVYRRPTGEISELLRAEDADPVQTIERMDEQQKLHAALSRLTGEQQQVITLRFGGSYSLEETALLMGKNANAIKALQFRALAALRRLLDDHR
jgi:RNA polymerase sigma-70 factor (ECF subfamily)